MKLRKVAAGVGIAAGTALAFAPVASADLIDFAESSNASLFTLFNPGEELTDEIFISCR